MKQSDKRKVVLVFRVNSEELAKLHKKAFLFAGGNMSKFVREAALQHEPKKQK